MVEHKEFWDKRADKYSQRPIADETTYQKKLEITRKYFREDMEVLEIGCGTGSTAIAHAPYVKHSLDVVMAHNLLHLLDNRNRVIEDVYQKLKPGDVFTTRQKLFFWRDSA
jgi:SAM-dependent methyltransferase